MNRTRTSSPVSTVIRVGSLDNLPTELSSPKKHRKTRRPRAVYEHQPANTPTLVVPDRMWGDVRNAMMSSRLNGDEEVCGFLLCDRHGTGGDVRYLARHWIVPSPEDYAHQSVGGLTLRQTFHLQLLTTWVPQGYHVVHLHTHPGMQMPQFSSRDDNNETSLSASLFDLPGSRRLISGVFNQNMTQGTLRIWAGKHGTHQPIDLQCGWIPRLDALVEEEIDDPLFDRQRIFGNGVQRQLGKLRVALIGCGGLGAPFAEELSRLGVRSWILVDDDHIDISNLHRLPFATREMADLETPKVNYVRSLIRRFWHDRADVQVLAEKIETAAVQRAVEGADLIVVGTDNQASRLIAQQIALRAMRPLLCLGTSIDKRQGEEYPRIYTRVTMPPLDGHWCLACGQVIDLNMVAQEQADHITRAQLAKGGYLTDVDAPAVYWVNTMGASLGVRLVHGALSGFIDIRNGYDEIYDLTTNTPMQLPHDDEPGCFFCSPETRHH